MTAAPATRGTPATSSSIAAATPPAAAPGTAGPVVHVVGERDGDPCTCGGGGCLETVAAGPWLAKWAREHGWAAGPEADAKELAAAAAAGDALAVKAFRRGATAVAMMIA